MVFGIPIAVLLSQSNKTIGLLMGLNWTKADCVFDPVGFPQWDLIGMLNPFGLTKPIRSHWTPQDH